MGLLTIAAFLTILYRIPRGFLRPPDRSNGGLPPLTPWHMFTVLLFTVSLLAVLTATSWNAWRITAQLKDYDKLLVTKNTPQGLKSLALATSKEKAETIISEWRKTNLIGRAKSSVQLDNEFIGYYVTSLLSLIMFTFLIVGFWELRLSDYNTPRSVSKVKFALLVLLLLTIALAFSDMVENKLLAGILNDSKSQSFASLRFYSQAKLILAAIVIFGVLITFLVEIRQCVDATLKSDNSLDPFKNFVSNLEKKVKRFQTEATEYINKCFKRKESQQASANTFKTLFNKEVEEFKNEYPNLKFEIDSGPAEEPRVIECHEDLFGLALSGGGIRSATFNLGLLQGLNRVRLLEKVHYLATVSGGGYIGGFWSKWKKNNPLSTWVPDSYLSRAPNESPPADDTRVPEAPQIRHLREFSKFLVPRSGIFDTETWGAVVALVAGIIPSLLAAISVLGLTLIAWLVLTFYLACPDLTARIYFSVGLTWGLWVIMEVWWVRDSTTDNASASLPNVTLRLSLALALVALVTGHELLRGDIGYRHNYSEWEWINIPYRYENWWIGLGITAPHTLPKGTLIWLPHLYEPALIWGIVALAFVAFRFRGVFTRSSIERRVAVPVNDRTTMRLFGLAAFWTVLASLWHLALNLEPLGISLTTLGTSAAGTAGLFGLLRHWIGQFLTRPSKIGLWERAKPYVPQILAYLTVAMIWIALGNGLIKLNSANWYSWYFTAALMGVVVMTVLLVDPHEFGLHAVYRDRICRAFLGAVFSTGQMASQNRQTDFRKTDDLKLKELDRRPLHLICCAANNLGGDHLGTLSRGSKSATLSRNGISMGNSWLELPEVYLGSAITASAAAANSNMGSISMQLGPAVSFLMSALNIRLGLWVSNPTRQDDPLRKRLLPGLLFYKEMFALTSTSAREIHLSDGAHFDNLGLYELVRRHCRYILVSDCTADSDVAFDDFANTARRIREDFNIEIQIDLDPLKPGTNGLTRYHTAVGLVDYGPFDKGTIIYIKPSLTGDEPADVMQYKSRNREFPHESTGDQFYDEAQWESYRRLGVHTINQIFTFDERDTINAGEFVQVKFERAKQVWFATPTDLIDRSLQMTTRLSLLEEQIKSEAKIPMLSEVFPELNEIKTTGVYTAKTPPQSMPSDKHITNLGCLLKVLTLMEDTIVACSLQTHWDHPLNLGWVNLFARWATAPTFRMWWPLLRMMYGPALRNFLEERFAILSNPANVNPRISEVMLDTHATGHAVKWWRERDDFPLELLNGKKALAFEIDLHGTEDTHLTLQVAVVVVTIEGTTAKWTSDEFFVPLSIWGSPLAVDFLSQLSKHLKENSKSPCKTIEVTVKGLRGIGNNTTKWAERETFVDFYRRAGFKIKEYLNPTSNVAPNDVHRVILTKALQ